MIHETPTMTSPSLLRNFLVLGLFGTVKAKPTAKQMAIVTRNGQMWENSLYISPTMTGNRRNNEMICRIFPK
jgi:hypothetical protein